MRHQPIVIQARFLRKTSDRFLLLSAELLGQRDVRLHVHVATTAVLLDPHSRNPEPLAVLRARRDPQYHALAVERLHFDARSQHGLGDVDRHDADDVQSLAPEEAVGSDVNHRDEIAAPLRSLILEPEARAVLDAGRDIDVDALLYPYFAAALTCGTALRWDCPLPPAHRARTIHREAALTKRDCAATLALWAGVDGRTLCGTGTAARRAYFGHRERDRHRAAQRGDPEGNRDAGFDFLGLRFAAGATTPEDRREEITQSAKIGNVEVAALLSGRSTRAARPPPVARAAL